MNAWRPVLSALLAWAIHFFGAYGLMLVLPDKPIVVWLSLALGVACLAFLASLLRPVPRDPKVVTATFLAAVAIIWQSIVGLF